MAKRRQVIENRGRVWTVSRVRWEEDVERVTGSKARTFDEFAREHAAVFR